MGVFTDKAIQTWISKGEHCDLRSDGDGLCLSFRKNFAVPVWRFRYRFAGKHRVMVLGRYKDLSLADARKLAKELRSRVGLGYDVASEKQDRIKKAKGEIEAKQNEWTVKRLADEYFSRKVRGTPEAPEHHPQHAGTRHPPSLGQVAGGGGKAASD